VLFRIRGVDSLSPFAIISQKVATNAKKISKLLLGYEKNPQTKSKLWDFGRVSYRAFEV
jgi:hypothetical protein